MPCDTGVLRVRGATYFLKNSDRHPNEEQRVEAHRPRAGTASGASLHIQATFIQIDNTREDSLPIIISRPTQMWGAEMGCNSAGVAIGNEALFSTVVEVPRDEKHLTGMDLVRLGLERGHCAREAVEVITALLEQYGQGGPCGFQDTYHMYYHNGFVVCDAAKCFIVIAVGREWGVVDCSENTVITLSNTIPRNLNFADFAQTSAGFDPHVVGGCSVHTRLLASKWGYASLQDYFANGACRQSDLQRGLSLVEKASQRTVDIFGEAQLMGDLFNCLRRHGVDGAEAASSGAALCDPHPAHVSVCMHAGWGPIRICHTTGSMVVRFGPPLPYVASTFVVGDTAVDVWSTMTSTPCMSAFKPVRYAPDEAPSDLWWKNEHLLRRLAALAQHAVAARYCEGIRQHERAMLSEFYDKSKVARMNRDVAALHSEQWAAKLMDAELERVELVSSKPWTLLGLALKTVLSPFTSLQLLWLAHLSRFKGPRIHFSHLLAALVAPGTFAGICVWIALRRFLTKPAV